APGARGRPRARGGGEARRAPLRLLSLLGGARGGLGLLGGGLLRLLRGLGVGLGLLGVDLGLLLGGLGLLPAQLAALLLQDLARLGEVLLLALALLGLGGLGDLALLALARLLGAALLGLRLAAPALGLELGARLARLGAVGGAALLGGHPVLGAAARVEGVQRGLALLVRLGVRALQLGEEDGLPRRGLDAPRRSALQPPRLRDLARAARDHHAGDQRDQRHGDPVGGHVGARHAQEAERLVAAAPEGGRDVGRELRAAAQL